MIPWYVAMVVSAGVGFTCWQLGEIRAMLRVSRMLWDEGASK